MPNAECLDRKGILISTPDETEKEKRRWRIFPLKRQWIIVNTEERRCLKRRIGMLLDDEKGKEERTRRSNAGQENQDEDRSTTRVSEDGVELTLVQGITTNNGISG